MEEYQEGWAYPALVKLGVGLIYILQNALKQIHIAPLRRSAVPYKSTGMVTLID